MTSTTATRNPHTFATIDGKTVRVRSVKTTRVPFIPCGLEMVPASRKDGRTDPRAVSVTTVTVFFASDVKGKCRYRVTQTVTGPRESVALFVGTRKTAVLSQDGSRADFDTFM